MRLNEIIKKLEQEDENRILKMGFHNPHSYRIYCECLAFEPVNNISIKDVLITAKEAIGKTYDGYKGGTFKMSWYTICYLAYYGESGEEIGERLLEYMLMGN